MRISDWSSDVCSSDLLLVSFPFGLGFALAGNAYVALACFVVVKFTMTLHLGPIIALCFAQVPGTMRAMMSATINMVIGLAGVGLGGTVDRKSVVSGKGVSVRVDLGGGRIFKTQRHTPIICETNMLTKKDELRSEQL